MTTDRNIDNFTVGCEIESRIVEIKSLKPKNEFDFIESRLSKDNKKFLKKEVLKSVLEVVTPVCKTPKSAIKHIRSMYKEINSIALSKNLAISNFGIYPISSKKEDNNIEQRSDYLSYLEEFQYLLKDFTVCGIHVHVFIKDKEELLRAYNASVTYSPLFLALSTSSPIFKMVNTNIHSYRTKIFDRLPRSGLAEYYKSYEEFKKMLKIKKDAKYIKNSREIRSFVRINLKYNTIELRICDSIANLKRIESIIAFFQAFCFYFKNKNSPKLFYVLNSQNLWNAVRYSTDGKFTTQNSDLNIKDKIYNLVKEIDKEDVFKKLSIKNYSEDIIETSNCEPISQKMMNLYQDKDVNGMIKLGYINYDK